MTSDATIVLRNEDLEALYELANDLLRLDDYDQMLDTVVRRGLDILRANRP